MSGPDAQTRSPKIVRPHRMAPLATLPIFFKLAGRPVIVAGGSEAAAWKAELLAASGAIVAVIDPQPCAQLEFLQSDPPGGAIYLERRQWLERDFVGAALVVGAAADEAEAARIYGAARSAGVPVNVIDRPAYCTFQFGAVVNRSPLVIGISTDGGAPVFAQAIRSRIEALLPTGFSRWAQAAKEWRHGLGKLSTSVRRRFWELFSDMALAQPGKIPDAGDRARLLASAVQGADNGRGLVSLVGAGPGNPELLTLRAVRALRSADVILFDDLVAPEILDFARREAKHMLVGKTGRKPSCKQDEINTLMVDLAKKGKRVVRLKGGDPLIFGRASEEMCALRAAGIEFEVVPGISAVQGAAASLAISLTDRNNARRLQLVRGHASNGKLPEDLDVNALAEAGVTTVVYMPLGTWSALSRRLIEVGADPVRPVAAIFNATRANEVVIAGTIASIGENVERYGLSGPCIFLIGNVLLGNSSVWARGSTAGSKVRVV